LDSAKAELEASQLDYDRILTTTAAENVLEARARVATARMMLDNSQQTYDQLRIGENSLTVDAAGKAVEQAEAAEKQAKAGLSQAQAALDLLDLQISKAAVTAPISGTVLSLNLDEGEMVSPGSTVIVLGQLEEVTLTVYVPEDQYGRISLGQPVSVTVDSFSNRTFTGTVRHISDEAEFTPRNVQTEAGRKTTVYAVEISLSNADGSLKPGMSADATID
jgi:RND family efflux transporter MFP subunit